MIALSMARSPRVRSTLSHMFVLRPRVFVLLLTVLATPATGAVVNQQSLPEPVAKAGFLLNFARFTEWPAKALPKGASLLICTTDRDVAAALESTVAGRQAHERPVTARLQRLGEPMHGCAVFHAGRADADRLVEMLHAVGDLPVLTVSDEPGFARLGGNIELFVRDGRMGFLVNRAAARRAGLSFSSRLLRVAALFDE